MIEGDVGRDGLPRVYLIVGEREWPAAIDTGFNGDLELPQALAREVGARYQGTVYSLVADGRQIFEDSYRADLPFDGELVPAAATVRSAMMHAGQAVRLRCHARPRAGRSAGPER